MKYGYIMMIAISALLLAGCEVQEIPEDDFGVPDDVTDPGDVEEYLIEICGEEGGEWREFPNTCVDSCEAARDEHAVCGQALTYGCDCGDGMCWDGQTCVEI